MKTRLLLLTILAAGTTFAQTRFSVRIGVGERGYYAPDNAYSQGYSRPVYGGDDYAYRGRAYGYDPEREHERAERRALRRHQMEERWEYGNSHELREHQRDEHHNLKHEQWHERHGDGEAAYGPGHSSAEDGYGHRH